MPDEHKKSAEIYDTAIYNTKEKIIEEIDRTTSLLKECTQQTNSLVSDASEQTKELHSNIEKQKNTKKNLEKIQKKIRGLYKYKGLLPFTSKYLWQKKKEETENHDVEEPVPDCYSDEEKNVCLKNRNPEAPKDKMEKKLSLMQEQATALNTTAKSLKMKIEEQNCLLSLLEQNQIENSAELRKYQEDLEDLQ